MFFDSAKGGLSLRQVEQTKLPGSFKVLRFPQPLGTLAEATSDLCWFIKLMKYIDRYR